MQEVPHTLKIATVWLLAGLVVFLGFQWWLDHQQQTRFQIQGERLEIRRGADGHYHWPGTIDGHEVDFLIDTGATSTAMPRGLAERLKLPARGTVQSHTAGGVATGTLVRADIRLEGGVAVERLLITALPGLDGQPLLGMDVLGKLHWQQRDGVLSIDLRDGR